MTAKDDPQRENADRRKSRTKHKNPAAVTLGRRGGLRGGPARAEALSPEQRKAIARRAANARWRKTEDGG